MTQLVRIQYGLSVNELNTRGAYAVFRKPLSVPARTHSKWLLANQGYTPGAAWSLSLLSVPTCVDSTSLLRYGMADKKLVGFQLASSLSKDTEEVQCGVWHNVEFPNSYGSSAASRLRKCAQQLYLQCLELRWVSRLVRIPHNFFAKQGHTRSVARCLALCCVIRLVRFHMASPLMNGTQVVHLRSLAHR